MIKSQNSQKKNTWVNYAYATLVGLVVVALAVTIAFVNGNFSKNNTNMNVNQPTVEVKNEPTYTLPMKNATIVKDYSGSELQYNNTLKQWEIHKGIDFIAGDDTNVYAMSSGSVSNVYTNYLEGTVVEIAHNNGLVSVYKSLSETKVKVGDKVITGQIIGSIGQTMASEANTGAHLHFEILQNDIKLDPNNYLDLGKK